VSEEKEQVAQSGEEVRGKVDEMNRLERNVVTNKIKIKIELKDYTWMMSNLHTLQHSLHHI
jgi:hypothetical protein